MSTRRGRCGWILAAIVAATVAPVSGQDVSWDVATEIGASLFFGNTEQTTITTRGSVERADSTLELSTSLAFNYGEASDADGNDFVNKRSWALVAGGDYRPFARVTPFFFGTVESSFESKIDSRLTGGAGGKVVFVRNDLRRIDLSLALMGERTTPLVQGIGAVDTETLARWSWRFRYSREWEEAGVTFSSVTFYRPVYNEWSRFTMESETSFSFDLTDRTDVRLSFLDRYDSGAEDRGARTNNDGQFIVGIVTNF